MKGKKKKGNIHPKEHFGVNKTNNMLHIVLLVKETKSHSKPHGLYLYRSNYSLQGYLNFVLGLLTKMIHFIQCHKKSDDATHIAYVFKE